MEHKVRPWVIAAGLKVIAEDQGLFARLKAYDATGRDTSNANATGPSCDTPAEKDLPDQGPRNGPS